MRTLSFGLVLLAFGLADDKPAATTTPYYPLKVGTTWTYKVDDARLTVTVVKEEDVDKLPCARVESSSGGNLARQAEDLTVKADGVYRAAVADKKVEPPVKILPLPPDAGEWKIDAKVGDDKLQGKLKCEKAAEEITVPAGTYKDVIKVSGQDIDANGLKLNVTYYFAKDVGVVKWVIKIGDKESVCELEKFEAAK